MIEKVVKALTTIVLVALIAIVVVFVFNLVSPVLGTIINNFINKEILSGTGFVMVILIIMFLLV